MIGTIGCNADAAICNTLAFAVKAVRSAAVRAVAIKALGSAAVRAVVLLEKYTDTTCHTASISRWAI